MPWGLRLWKRKGKKKARDVESAPPVVVPIANSSTLASIEPADELSPRQRGELMGLRREENRQRRDESDDKLDSALTATSVVLGLVIEAADAAPFGVLKAAASLSLKIVEICQAVKENDNQYRILADDATQFIAVIWRSYQHSSNRNAWVTPDMEEVMQDLYGTLNDIIEFVEEKRTRGTLDKTLANAADVSQIKAYKGRIYAAVKRFEIFSHLKVTGILLQVLDQQDEIKQGLLSNGIAVGASGGKVLSPQDEARLKVVYDTAAPNAILNAGGRADEVRCYPGTRKEVLAKSEEWMDPPAGQQVDDSEKGIFWLSGPAGAGKSAIVQTLAEHRLAKKLPMANFFFFRNDSTRSNAGPLVATILTQLFELYLDLKVLISAVLREKPNILRQSLSNQFQHLIDNPIRTLRDSSSIQTPIVLLIDGLDECSSAAKHEQQSLLKVLVDLVSRDDSPFLVVIASRPEPHLTMTFNELGWSSKSIFLDEQYRPEDDIRRFVVAELDRIKRTHHLRRELDKGWPTEDGIHALVIKSSGQFIYAAMAIRFISGSTASPAYSLDQIRGIRPLNRSSPFAELDALYAYILSQVADWESTKNVLTAHFLLKERQATIRLYYGLRPLGYTFGDISTFVSDLTAIVNFSDAGVLKLHHASFPDFLLDKTRSQAGDYYIDVQKFCDTWAPNFVKWIRDGESLMACEVIIDQVSEPSLSITEALLSFPTLGFQFAHNDWVAPVRFMGLTLRNYCGEDKRLSKQLVQLWIEWFRKHKIIFDELSSGHVVFDALQFIKLQLEPGVWEEIICPPKVEKQLILYRPPVYFGWPPRTIQF